MNQLPSNPTALFHWACQFDWFQCLSDIPQDPLWHAEGDVLTHTRMVVEALEAPDSREGYLLTLAAVLHDIGKATTTETNDEGRIIAPRHAIVGARQAQSILRKLLTPRERVFVCELIRLHGRPPHAWDTPVLSAVLSHTVPLSLLTTLVEADIAGRICSDEGTMIDRFTLWKDQVADWPDTPYPFPNANAGYQAFHNELDVLPTAAFQPKWDMEVIFLSGLPGAGKDTYHEQHLSHLPMLSLDKLRKSMGVVRGKSKLEGHMLQATQEQFRQFLRDKQTFVFNASNLTKSLRSKWIRLALQYGAKVSCVYIEPDTPTLLHQNANRATAIPESGIHDLYAQLEVPHPLEFHSVDYVWS